MRTIEVPPSTLTIKQGDITREDVDIIVTAANSRLMGGGGVDGAVHRAAGPKLLYECKRLRQEKGLVEPGSAVITSAGNLKIKFVIHAVGPVWQGGGANERKTLMSAYKKALDLAVQANIKSIAFPSISTGSYSYPIDFAAPTAIEAIKTFLSSTDRTLDVRLILFTEADYKTYDKYLK